MLRRQELFSAAAWPWYSCLAQVSSPNLRQAARNWNITLEEKNKLCDYLVDLTKSEAEKYAKGKAWTRIIWDVTAVAWLLDGDFEEDYLVHSPIPGYDNHYVLDPQRHFIRYVYHVKRDSLFTDLFAKLGRS